MSTLELKQKIITRIRESQNPDLLKEVIRLLEIESEDIDVYNLSEEQRKGIDQAREEIKNGKFISNEQSDKEIDEWLRE
ncbi:MAG: hypothetical protein M3R36_08600 [Bacteroidota bacterium]|nr:hypothetical protein [Bacteroidota bacterium]